MPIAETKTTATACNRMAKVVVVDVDANIDTTIAEVTRLGPLPPMRKTGARDVIAAIILRLVLVVLSLLIPSTRARRLSCHPGST